MKNVDKAAECRSAAAASKTGTSGTRKAMTCARICFDYMFNPGLGQSLLKTILLFVGKAPRSLRRCRLGLMFFTKRCGLSGCSLAKLSP
jgi:hypothetical protein